MQPLTKNRSVLTLALVGPTLVSGCTPAARKARHLARADKYFDAVQYPQAEIEYLTVLNADHENTHAFSRLGIIYFEEGRLSRAYPCVAKAMELNSPDPAL